LGAYGIDFALNLAQLYTLVIASKGSSLDGLVHLGTTRDDVSLLMITEKGEGATTKIPRKYRIHLVYKLKDSSA